jgi:protein required for attachment to host cells
MTNIRIPAGALVLIADGKKARLLRNKGNALHVDFRTERELAQENLPMREQGTDKPGRYLSADRVSRSAVEQTDWHQQTEERFAAQISNLLYGMAHAHTFDHLVVIAAPKVLGNLRAAFHPEVATRVLAEVAKDLTSVSTHDLAKRLSLTPRSGIGPRQ